jgi:hypothetical protein
LTGNNIPIDILVDTIMNKKNYSRPARQYIEVLAKAYKNVNEAEGLVNGVGRLQITERAEIAQDYIDLAEELLRIGKKFQFNNSK